MKKAPLKHHYSGNHSKRFWSRVNRLENVDYKDAVYLLCCSLQDLERRVLQFMEMAERRALDAKEGT